MLTGPADTNVCNHLQVTAPIKEGIKKTKAFKYICLDFISELYSISSVYTIYMTIMAVLYYTMVV